MGPEMSLNRQFWLLPEPEGAPMARFGVRLAGPSRGFPQWHFSVVAICLVYRIAQLVAPLVNHTGAFFAPRPSIRFSLTNI